MKQAGLPTVVVLIAGRPMILDPLMAYADAIVLAWLLGSEGAGITDILFGDAQPSGKLPHSWPRSMAQIPINIATTKPVVRRYVSAARCCFALFCRRLAKQGLFQLQFFVRVEADEKLDQLASTDGVRSGEHAVAGRAKIEKLHAWRSIDEMVGKANDRWFLIIHNPALVTADSVGHAVQRCLSWVRL